MFLEIKGIKKSFGAGESRVDVLKGIDLEIEKGEFCVLLGPSGSGKSTTGRSVIRLYNPTAGEITFDGHDIGGKMTAKEKQFLKTKMQMIFQDPMACLNPREKVMDIIAEGLDVHHLYSSQQERAEKVYRIMERVGLTREQANRYPHQFSGGMKQRVVIAIALACNPDLLICDEPTTALDVTIQAQVLDMITDLKKKRNMALIMITHDLAIVAETCDKVAVVYAGQIVEYGTVRQLFKNPSHPYSLGLFGAIPMLDKDVHRLSPINGAPPDPTHLPEGCYFRTRCPYVTDACRSGDVAVVDLGEGHLCKCCRFDKKQEG